MLRELKCGSFPTALIENAFSHRMLFASHYFIVTTKVTEALSYLLTHSQNICIVKIPRLDKYSSAVARLQDMHNARLVSYVTTERNCSTVHKR